MFEGKKVSKQKERNLVPNKDGSKRSEDFNTSKVTPVHSILQLQQTIGNQAVVRLIRSGNSQAKPRINQPRDKYNVNPIISSIQQSSPGLIQRSNGDSEQISIPSPRELARHEIASQLDIENQISQQIASSMRWQARPSRRLSPEQMLIALVNQVVSPMIEDIVIPVAEGTMNFFRINRVLGWFGVDQETVREAIRTGVPEGIVAGIRAGTTAGVDRFLELNVENETLRGRLSSAFSTTFTRALQYRGGEISVNREDTLQRIFSEIRAQSTEQRGTMPSPPQGVITLPAIRW